MLSPDEVTALRAKLGIPSTGLAAPAATAATPSPEDRIAELRGALPYTQRVATKMGDAADTAGQGFTDAAKNIGTDFQDYQSKIKGADPLSSILHTLVFAGHTAGEVAGAAGKVAAGAAKAAVSPLSEMNTPKGDTVGSRFATPIKETAQKGVDALKTAHPEVLSWLSQQAASHPDVAKGIGDLVNTIGLTGVGKIANAPIEGALPAAKEVAKGLATGIKDTASAVVRTPEQSAQNIAKWYAQKAADPQLKTSALRLQDAAPLRGAGAAMQKPLVEVYDDFAKQEAKHLADIKHDPAISLVGQRIGDAFQGVVKQRQAAGKTMAAELAKTANKPVDTKAAFGELQKELIDNGVSYDAKTREIIPGAASKFSEADSAILGKYASELQKIGSKPTMAQLDAFISRIPKDIEGLKASRNIQFSTNAERIIKTHLDHLREALGKVGTPAYNDARAQYSQLSDFMNEGASHLGKITQSGDFAKDASLAKSAVQSVLNNGKKDWLIKLEDLSGYPALDEATLALQAMKDAGDSKASSLLELLGEQAVKADIPPTTLGGVLYHLGKAGYTKGKNKVVGSPAEQTRAYLRSIKRNQD